MAQPHPKAILFLRFCIQYASIALLYYDYALTFGREVKFFWTKKFTISTVLYIACRYAMVANVLYTLALSEKLPTMRYVLIFPAAVWGARTYAVFNRSKIILLIFAPLGIFTTVLATIYVPYIACNGSRGSPPKVTSYLTLCTVLYETLSTVLTTIRGFQSIRIDGTWKLYRRGLIYLILEQGLIYFGLVSGFSIAALILQHKGTPGSFTQRLLNALTLPLSGQMTARFLLHLREWEYLSRKSTAQYSMFTRTGNDDNPIQFRIPEMPVTRLSADDDFELRGCPPHEALAKGSPPVASSSTADAGRESDADHRAKGKLSDEVYHAM